MQGKYNDLAVNIASIRDKIRWYELLQKNTTTQENKLTSLQQREATLSKLEKEAEKITAIEKSITKQQQAQEIKGDE